MIFPVVSLFSLFSVLFLLGKSEQRVKKIFPFLCLVWLALTLIATFRSDMADMEAYLMFWEEFGGERFEIGFATLTDLLHSWTTDKYCFFFVFAALSVALKISAVFRMSPLVWASLLVYIANIFILHDMIQMRCAVASGLLLHAVYYLGNHDSKRFIITAVLAFLFHYSAIIIFPLCFLGIQKSYRLFYIGLIIFSYFFGGGVFPIASFLQYIPIEGIQNLWTMYEDTVGDEVNIFNAVQLGRVTVCIFLFLFIDRISFYNKYAILLVKIYAVSIVSFVLFSNVPVIAFRVSELYQVVEIVLIPMIVYAFPGKVLLKRMAVVCIGLCFLLMNIYYIELLK